MIIAQMPIGVQMLKTSMGQVSPELEAAARICGALPARVLYSIVLPLVRPTLASIFVIVFVAAMRDVSTIILFAGAGSQTLSLLMMQFAMSSNLEASAVIGVIITAIITVVALLARRVSLRTY
jgi:iron(III) transport system permease protein